jgi:tetratricopeptide (TPR) repeat protein
MVPGERIKQKVHTQHKAPGVWAFCLCVVILLMAMADCFVPRNVAVAQNSKTFGIIRGTAFDASTKIPIPGVIINYVGPADVKGKVMTNEKGNYEIIGLLPGSYILNVESKGYRPVENLRAIVAAGTDTVLEIKMFKAEFKKPFFRDMLMLLKMKANPEESPLACALLVAITIEDDNEKNKVFADIAVEYAKAGQCDQAILIAKTIEDADYNGRPLAYIAVEYAKTGKYDQATQVTNTIVNDYKGWPLAYIAVEYAKAGQYDRAIQLTQTIEDTFHKAWALAEMVAMYAKAGQYDEAIQLAQTIEKAPLLSPLWGDASFHKAMALSEIAARYSESGQMDKAFQLLSQAIQVAKAIEDTYYESLALAEIAGKYAVAGQYDQAIQLAQTIGDAYSKARALAEIAARYEDRFNNLPSPPFPPLHLTPGPSPISEREAWRGERGVRSEVRMGSPIKIAQNWFQCFSSFCNAASI